MKKLYLILLISLAGLASRAQDKIFLQTGEQITGKVIEIQEDLVKYKRADNKSGIVYTTRKKNVFMVQYENGTTEFFNAKNKKKEKPTPILDGANLIHIHAFDMVYNDLTFSYERLIKGGKIGLQVPFGIGYNKVVYYGYGDYSNKFYSGLNINLYPTGQGKWSFFVGPSIRYGMGKSKFYSWDEIGNSTEVIKSFYYGKLFVNLGIMYSPSQSFSISAIGSLGIKYFNESIDTYIDKGIYSAAHFSINFAYRF